MKAAPINKEDTAKTRNHDDGAGGLGENELCLLVFMFALVMLRMLLF